MSPTQQIEAFIKAALEKSLAPSHHVWIQWEVCGLEEGPHLTMLEPRTQTSNFQNCRDKFVSYKTPSYGLLL